MASNFWDASSWGQLIILNKTTNLSPATAFDCLCPADPIHWPVTLLLNRTSPNILSLCKFMFSTSLHPLAFGALKENLGGPLGEPWWGLIILI